MGKGVVEDGAMDEACAECRRVCQTTHGKGLPHSVPRFFKTISDYSTPSSSYCNLQIPAPYIRNHLRLNRKEKYTLEAVPGCEWVVTLKNVAFRTGWKEFSLDYQLEKGDGIMLTLVAPKRFCVNVFDKSGMEKVSTKQYMKMRASPICKENQVAEITSGDGGAEDPCTPVESNGIQLHGEEKSNGALHPTVHCASALSSGQNGNHDNRTLFEDKHRPVPNEPVRHEVEPSTTSQSSDNSEDSIEVRLAKAVLAKSREKKLKKKGKASCTSAPQAAEGTLSTGPEACKNGDKANGTSNVVPTDSSLKIDGTAVSVDEAMVEKPSGELGVLTNTCPPLLTEAVVGASNVQELIELQAEPQPEKSLLQEEAPLPQQRPDTATGDGVPVRRIESNSPAGSRPHPLFLPGFVKLEPDLSPNQNCEKCSNCGKRKEETNSDRPSPPKSEPRTTESPSLDVRTPEARIARSNAPRVTEYQKQRALSAAKELSANTENPNALVVMRVSMPADSYDCFLSVKCSEMLPPEPTELTLLDTEGNARKVNWKPNQRNMNGPGWKDLVDSHNLQINDVWVMEVIDPSKVNFVVKVHILHAHKMERSPDPQPPAVPAAPAAPVPTDPAKTPAIQAKDPAVPAPVPTDPAKTPAIQAKDPAIPAPVPILGTQTAVVGTGAKTRSSSQLDCSIASRSKTNKRKRTLNVNELLVQTQAPRLSEISRPAATNTVDDNRRMTRSSPMKRPRRGSSPSTPQKERDSKPTSGTGEEPSQAAKPLKEGKQQAVRRRHSLYTPHVQNKEKVEAVIAQRGGASQSARKVHLRSNATNESAENPKQVQTRNSHKKHYRVARMIDRRKSLQGVVFLVELTDRVSPESIHKRMTAQQDEKGRWWVPHHHFSKDLSTCYIE